MTSLLCFQVRSEVRFEEIPGFFFFTFYFPLSLSSIFRLHQLPRSTLTHDSEHANRLTAAGECVRNFAEKSEMTRALRNFHLNRLFFITRESECTNCWLRYAVAKQPSWSDAADKAERSRDAEA